MRRLLAALAAAIALAGALPAQAGRSCDTRPPQAAQVVRSLTLAARTAEALDATGAQVVLLARAGQDLSRWHLRWSHLGYAYRDAGRWRVLHKLNACGTARGDLYRQGLGEFFLDDLFELQAAVLVPTQELQARLLPLLADNRRAATLHEPAYNMVAYPWVTRYQQSNQWALETLALALEPQATSRERAQAWLKLQGYAPTVLRVPALERLGANVGRAHISFDDHPNGQRFSGRIATVTVDSVFDWLQQRGWAAAPQVLRP